MSDQTPVDVDAIRARLDAATITDGRSIGAIQNGKKELRRHAPTDLRDLLDENARLNAELAARDTRIEALSEALAAKNRELDKVIQGSLDAGAEWASKMEAVRARIADLEELKCSVCGMRVAHLNCNGHVIGWGCADGEECAPEMPRPPVEEAQERPETPGAGSGRGTGVAEAPGTAQADEGGTDE